ncbi:transcriptional regulator FtsR [Kineosporia succinea]|uniref:DNA-binding transcriptional MerR regulator n=1 Tax=Kineosporia succinea TaxID=84632 RepID=A0ABT9P762_9ACTN|nr:MerR family transcriptional regulator [Kineosporia succinea]MDP9828528.1 DNA-binding transcriptional MerR regulator [Kineosporia succinea]
MSIGAVLELLRQDFPDISISKIRYLEDQGLVEPERTASGYRKFTPGHVERLRYVLGVQRDHYMPLRVIREHLDAIDHGLEAPVGRFGAGLAPGPFAPRLVEAPPAQSRPEPQRRFTRAQVLIAAEIDDDVLSALESHGLVSARAAGWFDADAVTVARTAGELATFGIEPRHLRAFRSAADREAGLIEQVTNPLRARGGDVAAQAAGLTQELSSLSVQLHAALLKAALERGQA